MLLSKLVDIKIDGRSAKYYEGLGYYIQKHIDKDKNQRYIRGRILTVSIEDLLLNSSVKVVG